MVELDTGVISIFELLFEKLLVTLLLGGVETPPSFQSQFLLFCRKPLHSLANFLQDSMMRWQAKNYKYQVW